MTLNPDSMMNALPQTDSRLPSKLISGWSLLIGVAIAAALTTWANYVFFRLSVVREIEIATAGIITATLQANVILILCVVVLYYRMSFQLTFHEMGLRTSQLGRGLLLVVAMFVLATGLSALLQFCIERRLNWNDQLSPAWLVQRLGELLGQLFGNALYEEVVFRGIVFRQLAAKWSRHSKRPRIAIFAAATVSSIVFALQHLPNRVLGEPVTGNLVLEMFVLTVAGLFFAAVYWQVGNLWIAIGFHAMANSLFYVWSTPEWSHAVVMTLICTLLLASGFWRKPEESSQYHPKRSTN